MADGGSASRFGWHALIYLGASLLTKGLWLLLTPLYTRLMSPADYGLVALANTVTSVLGIVFSLALYGAIPRLILERAPGAERARLVGSISLASLGFAVACAVGCEIAGRLGWLELFAGFDYRFYGRCAVWTAVLSNIILVPTQVYLAREEPRRVALVNVLGAVVQIGASMFFVMVLHWGGRGVVLANLVGAGCSALVAGALLSRLATVSFDWSEVRQALAFSVPLVPHLLANWALAVSDRLVLARYVRPEVLGLYSLGYLLSTGVGIAAASITTPISPAANRQLGDPSAAHNVPPLGTYALLAITIIALVTATTARELVGILAPSSYAGAADIAPWVILGAYFQGLYLIVSIGTWYSKKTGFVPVITVVSVLLNVGLNVAFVPRYGILVAAVSTALGYAVCALLHAILAHRNYPIPWEYRRWALMAGVALTVYFLLRTMTGSVLVAMVILKGLVCLSSFLVGLRVLGFFRPSELARASALFHRGARK